ncbi:AAA family ATPase [Pseudomonas putida]|uniref:AAA family ATPase n=1 Tax=Pseudomonas putida TaxID=303 RepID=UPI00345CFC50
MDRDRDSLIASYFAAGLALLDIPPDEHGQPRKGPEGASAKGWNLPKNAIRTHEAANRINGSHNIGVMHAYSDPPTCAIDIDDLDKARQWLAARGVDLDALLSAPDAVRISSGREGRAKLLYRLDAPLPQKKAKVGKKDIIDFRCGTDGGLTVQDVLPPSIHPDTGRPYVLEGDIGAIPPMPAKLLACWQDLLTLGKQANVELTLDLVSVDEAALAARLAAVQSDPNLKLLMEGKPPLWLKDQTRNGLDFALALTLHRLHFTPDQIAVCVANYAYGKLERHTDDRYISGILEKVCAPVSAAVLEPDSPNAISWQNLTLKDGAVTDDDLHKVDDPWPHAIYPSRPMGALAITGGANGIGKSTEVLSQELHIATGRDYWGLPVTQGRAIFISCEDPRRIIKTRMQAWLDALPEAERPSVERDVRKNFFFFGADETGGMQLTLKEFAKCEPSREAIELLVELGQGAVSITVETVAMLNGGDEMNTDFMQLALALKEVARRTGASVQAIHHISKEAVGKIPTIYSLRGASSLGDALRGATIMHELSDAQMRDLNITRIDGMPVMGLYNVKSSYAPCHAPIYIRRVPGPRFVQTDASESKAKENERGRLLQFLQKPENREGVSVRYLKDNCTKFRVEKRGIEDVLLKMEMLGSIVRVSSKDLGKAGPKHDIWMSIEPNEPD